MNDIQHWRRMIQPNRTRTPAIEPADDSDGAASPVTPRRGLKPKISSMFTLHGTVPKPDPSSGEDPFASRSPAWPDAQPYSPHPNPDSLIDAIMCRLMTDPHGNLDPRFNGMLMLVFESYRGVLDDKLQLQEQAEEASADREAMLSRLQQAQKQWTQERQEYKAEIRRLELLLAKGKRGLAEVTMARQDSRYRERESYRRSELLDDGLRTIFEVLERNQRENEKTWSSQRAVLRPRQVLSPSAPMRRLSQQLEGRGTTERVPLPVSSPAVAAPRTPTEASALDSHQALPEPKRPAAGFVRMKASFSDDTSSTFSCKGDWLPDEPNEAHSMGRASSLIDPAPITYVGTASSRRNGVGSPGSHRSGSDALGTESLLSTSISTTMGNFKAAATGPRHPSLMSKAAGFFQKLRPHASSDASDDLRFSFQTGEDAITLTSEHAPAITVRRSISVASLPVARPRTALSPVIQSPTTSATFSDSCRASRIPVPAYSSRSLARPRRERDDSVSSLTATTQSEGTASPVPVSPLPATHTHCTDHTTGHTSMNNLTRLDGHRLDAGSLIIRGNAFAAAAARDRRRADVPEQSDGVGPASRAAKAHAESDMSESMMMKENVPPAADLDASTDG
ncbi:hypothetical protein LTR53_001800 [Teratosphaeriaceae sp. CCFEE 6253]|nr:hypothetical protein LTR53_001800 [Teratosphaeriaceae sp. CCFEE 6253]